MNRNRYECLTTRGPFYLLTQINWDWAWINNYMHTVFCWYNCSSIALTSMQFVKLLLKLRHGWVMSSQIFMWLLLNYPCSKFHVNLANLCYFSVRNRSVRTFSYPVLIAHLTRSHNAPVPYPTMHHSEQKCSHFCSEWCIVGYGTYAFWDLWIRSISYQISTLNIIYGALWLWFFF